MSYPDKNQQHHVFELFIDKENIFFYELVLLIEEVGYSPAYDFLYYRKKYPCRKGYLVRIDNDIHVNKMISEHTNEKRVQLYVFREEANIDVAPSDPQHEVDGPATRLEDVFDEGAVKTKTMTSQRTVRRSKRLNVVQSRAEYTDGECDNTYQSMLSRDSLLETHDLEDNGNQVDSRDDRVDNISEYVDSGQWCELVRFWKSREGRVELENIITEHPELAQSEHTRVAWKGDALHKVLGNEKRGQVHGMGLLPVPNQVYGRKPRYLRNINVTTIDGSSHDGEADAMEEIAKLKQFIEQQDKIIDALRNNDEFSGANEITMENSQTIRNGESHPEVLHNNKRKRVQANGPGEENTVIKPRDTIMKETHPDRHGMHGDNDIMLGKQKHHFEHEGCNEFSYHEPSSLANHVCDVEIRKGKENMIENLTRLSKQSTQDKSLVHVSCWHTNNYEVFNISKQNTCGTCYYFGLQIKKLVGGVELGREFIEVQVDQPIDECELLIERFGG
ncbi:hypothetical protein D1007_48724 [Hordeum vulgare]|nr:hypothetical protein D1007_48724 [Hordeum vulgare]